MKIQACPVTLPSYVAPSVDVVYVREDADQRPVPISTLELSGPIVMGIRLAPSTRTSYGW